MKNLLNAIMCFVFGHLLRHRATHNSTANINVCLRCGKVVHVDRPGVRFSIAR